MPVATFKNIDDVAKAYQVRVEFRRFIELLPYPVDERFQQELTFNLENLVVKMSEVAVGEFLIAPILREIWKSYTDALLLWSHVAISAGEEFSGVPDYLFTKRSPLGMVRDEPYLLVVEAKKDDFDTGWGQCLAAMVAVQKLNGDERHTIYGVVSSGETWQFGKLSGKQFIRDTRSFTITDLPNLFAALHYIFEQAKQQALAV
jgi:hypothetical protein